MFWGFILFISLIYIFGSESMGMQFISYDSLLGYIVTGMIIALLIWFGTGYKIEDAILKFRTPALSVDRLEILYGKFSVMDISPKNEKEFIRLLVTEKPHIQIDEKHSNHQH